VFFLFLLLFIFIKQFAISQNLAKTDSLKSLWLSANEDSLKIKLLLELGDAFEPINSDSAEYSFNKALKLAKNNSDYLSICYNKLGLFYSNAGNYEMAINDFQLSLKIFENKNNQIEVASCYINIGEIYMSQGNYPKSLELFQKAVKILEKIIKSNDKTTSLLGKKGIVRCYNDLGGVHAENGNFSQATEYFKKALEVEEQIGDKRIIAGCNNNIGNVYYMQSNYPKAIEYYVKALKIAEELQDKSSMSERYNNLGVVFTEMRKYKEAIEYYKKSYAIDEGLGDQKGMSIVLGNISLLKIRLQNYHEAIKFAEKSLDIAKKIGALDEEKCAYNYLATAYDSLGDYKKTSHYLKLFKLTTDSIFNIESGRQIKEMEAVYQTEKKQKEIELLSKDKKLQEAELSKQETQKVGFIIGFILMIILSLVIFRSYNHKKKANTLLTLQKNQIEEKNEELNQQNEEIAAQRDEIEAQRDLVTIQKGEIEEIHSELTSSIHYAKRIQNAVLPNREFIETLLTDYFILLKPRNIVSGDFYWVTIRKNFLMVALADCTGHGVPGAFMSMLGISFLNEIIIRPDVNQASQVLDKLRDSVLKSLHQKDLQGEQKDGMDIAFVCINLESTFSDSGVEQYAVQFAGANNSLYIVKKSENEKLKAIPTFDSHSESSGQAAQDNGRQVESIASDFQLDELKGDKMPISIYRNMQGFTNHDFTLKKSDIIYLSSDGYSDQFGGPNERKYLSKNLKKLLLDNCDKPMAAQKLILEETIESWMNNFGKPFEQTDDITVMGIKI
jgi:tetratricopeptide (TPR) repeat protein